MYSMLFQIFPKKLEARRLGYMEWGDPSSNPYSEWSLVDLWLVLLLRPNLLPKVARIKCGLGRREGYIGTAEASVTNLKKSAHNY